MSLYDVVIIGAGMAGGCLARQLSLEMPALSVCVIDGKTDFDYSVGESTVEVFDDYALRNLQLGPYLNRHHIVKHGLRFWFDSENRDLPVDEMSEQGRSHYTILNRGFQIDRSRFDRDLCQINERSGIAVRLGCKIPKGSEIQFGDRYHTVPTTDGPIQCRYLVDAGGRNAPLPRQLGLVPGADEERGQVGSYWTRVRGMRSIDELGGSEWRGRVSHSLRWASTNHFMYEGYWFWLIPISDDVWSLGVTYHHDLKPLTLKNSDQFEQFARTHRCLDQLLGDRSEFLDFQGLKYLLRGSRQFFSEDRWFLTGMSGFFVDPMFSSNSAAIATNNRYIGALIEAAEEGRSDLFKNRVRHFNIKMRNLYLRQKLGFANYSFFGSFDAFSNWQTLRYHSILNYSVPLQHADLAPIVRAVDSHCGKDCGCGEGVWSPFQSLGNAGDRLTREFEQIIREHNSYHQRNRLHFHDKTEREATRRKTIELDFGPAVEEESRLNWRCFVRYYLQRACQMKGLSFFESRFQQHFDPCWESNQSLSELLDFMRLGPIEEGERPAEEWGFKGPHCRVQVMESCGV